jgi:hypothetical protein
VEEEAIIAAIITSPPYTDIAPRNDDSYVAEHLRAAKASGRTAGRATWGHNKGTCGQRDYGTAEGQVGALRAGPCPGGEAGVGDDVETLTWAGVYSQGWGRGLLSPGAFAHPAKFAYGLLTRLYDHGFERGWWHKHSLICDPFGGVGCGGVVAAYRGLRWIGCELEPRFIVLAEETFALHRGKWAAAGDTPPLILQGDSRQFAALVAGAAACITSPPWAAQMHEGGNTPAARGVGRSGRGQRPCEANGEHNPTRTYGTTPGQLGGLPAGDADSVITSPPYADAQGSPSLGSVNKDAWGSDGRSITARRGLSGDYGTTPGNVGNLAAGDADSVVTSPPYEGMDVTALDPASASGGQGNAFRRTGKCPRARGALLNENYPDAPGQVGRERGETYWDAVKCIYGQCLLALRPGGVACVVVKGFVRRGQLVDLPGQTWRLLLSLGFTPVERIRCLLAEETREPSLFGGVETRRKVRQSFFRALAVKKGAPEIPFEEVLVVRRPFVGPGDAPGTPGGGP